MAARALLSLLASLLLHLLFEPTDERSVIADDAPRAVSYFLEGSVSRCMHDFKVAILRCLINASVSDSFKPSGMGCLCMSSCAVMTFDSVAPRPAAQTYGSATTIGNFPKNRAGHPCSKPVLYWSDHLFIVVAGSIGIFRRTAGTLLRARSKHKNSLTPSSEYYIGLCFSRNRLESSCRRS